MPRNKFFVLVVYLLTSILVLRFERATQERLNEEVTKWRQQLSIEDHVVRDRLDHLLSRLNNNRQISLR